jgi:hypothetical protein
MNCESWSFMNKAKSCIYCVETPFFSRPRNFMSLDQTWFLTIKNFDFAWKFNIIAWINHSMALNCPLSSITQEPVSHHRNSAAKVRRCGSAPANPSALDLSRGGARLPRKPPTLRSPAFFPRELKERNIFFVPFCDLFGCFPMHWGELECEHCLKLKF